MKKDLLQAVVTVESAIQQNIEAERKKAASWLESVRVSLSREFEARKQELDDEYARALASTSQQCEIEARKEIADVNQLADALQHIPDEVLQEAVQNFIREMLPPGAR